MIIKEETKIEKKYLKDKYATRLFKDEDLREWTLKIISAVTKIDYKTLATDFKVIDIKVGPAEDVKALETDFIAENDKLFITMEFNYLEKYRYTVNKNFSYICAIILRQIKPGKNKEYNIKPIQISLDGYDAFKKGKLIYSSVFMEEEFLISRDNFIRIFDVNLDFLENLDYNDIRDYEADSVEKLTYLFVCSDKSKLDKIYLGDKLMEKVREKIEQLESNLDDYLYYNPDDLIAQNSYLMGYEDNQKKIINNMLQKGLTVEQISEYTELSIEEINKIIGDA